LSYPLEVWGPLTERLIAQGYRCIRYDLPGRGISSFDRGPLTSEALAGQTLAVLDHAEVDRAHIISLSNADLIALSLGVHAKARLRSLSLIAPSGWDARTMNLWTRLWCSLPGVSTLLSRSLRARLAERMRAHQAHLPEGAPSSTREIYAMAANSVLTNPTFGAAVQSHMGHMPSRRGLVELIEAFAATEIPTTLVHYAEEHDSTDAGIKPYIDGLPKATHVHLTQGTHMGLLEYPDALSDALLHQWTTVDRP